MGSEGHRGLWRAAVGGGRGNMKVEGLMYCRDREEGLNTAGLAVGNRRVRTVI